MPLPATSLLAAFFALLLVPLSLQISVRRVQLRTTAMDGEDRILRNRIRAFGNFTEYAPLMLILLGLVENAGAAPALAWSLAAAFAASRVAHAVGMLYLRRPQLRGAAMMVQHAAFVAGGLWLLLRALG